jgi:hypothetical protein
MNRSLLLERDMRTSWGFVEERTKPSNAAEYLIYPQQLVDIKACENIK